jgi:FtsH-binding integral membrane protein
MGSTGFVDDASIVVAAAVLTAAITIGLTVYAFYTKTDFTICGGLMFMLGFALLAVGLISIFSKSK